MSIKSFKDLIVWQKSMELVILIYKLTKNLPYSEKFGLAQQMQRAAVSIPSNIAEGFKRNRIGEFIHFLGISNGSAAELETQLLIVQKLCPALPTNQSAILLTEIQKMLNSIIIKNKSFLTPNS